MRISSVTIPDNKRVDIALTYIYGIGRSNVLPVLKDSQIDPSKKAKDLTEEEVKRVTKVLETYKIEGDLKADVAADIRRLKETGSYRGIRHTRGLPGRGQRTRSNARTKRGKRLTIGAIKKEVAAKMEASAKAKGK
jgi:small subunit ribosomal protein S13